MHQLMSQVRINSYEYLDLIRQNSTTV